MVDEEGRPRPRRVAGGEGLPPTVRRALVLGASRSGTSGAVALAGLGVDVVLCDRRSAEALPGMEEALRSGVRYVREDTLATQWPSPDLVIKSPGVPGEAELVQLALSHGVPVWSELELAYALLANPFDAVTGTNGKTTTTALLGHLFAVAGRPAQVLGNIGVAVTSVVGKIDPAEELVVEVSSFQLEDTIAFRPAVGVFINLTPDHLDRHGTMERYLACKANLFARQGPGDVAVLNLRDPAVAALGVVLAARAQGPRVSYFSATGPAPGGPHGDLRPQSWAAEGLLFLEGEPVLRVDEIKLPGTHNLENCLAAGAAALARGVDQEVVAEGLRSFRGVAHRLESAGMVAGVTYVNDSKATNVEATLTALNAYPDNTHLILGGRDKHSDYRPVARACARGCKAVYLIGEATPLIESAFAEVRNSEGERGVPMVRLCGDLESAVDAAAKAAVAGDVVLLAPACASFDQYKDFEERGEHFGQLVERLGGKQS
jgi:UDP-N-acetylmuramoylalanine--D-glutamate ligase